MLKMGLEKVDLFKAAMGNYPTGVTVVTALDENNQPIGLTVNSFASVSLDPLLVLWSIDKRVSTYDTFAKIDQFAINILSHNQADIAMLFASRNEDRFNNCDWTLSENHLPVIKNTNATLQCKTFKHVEAGDHMILIGEIIDIEVDVKTPLLYHNRKIDALPAEFHKENVGV